MTEPLPHIRGVIFDLWNTIAWSDYQPNPMVLIAEALGIADQTGWKKTIENGMMTRRFLGIREGLEALEAYTSRPLGGTEGRAALIRRWNEACAATKIYDDAMPALRALRGRCRLAILSNTQSFDVDFVRSSGIEPLVDAVCLSCDEGRLKPDPLFFEAALRHLRLRAGEVLMVGDSVEDDVRGALSAGLSALHLVRNGEAPPVPGATGSIRLLTEIPSLVL